MIITAFLRSCFNFRTQRPRSRRQTRWPGGFKQVACCSDQLEERIVLAAPTLDRFQNPVLFLLERDGASSILSSTLDNSPSISQLHEFPESAGGVYGIDVYQNTNHVFAYTWKNHEATKLHRLATDGTGHQQLSAPLGAIGDGIAVNQGNGEVYVAPHHLATGQPGAPAGGMQLVSADGTTTQTLAPKPYYVTDMEVDTVNGHVYYSGHSGITGIRRMNLDGTNDVSITPHAYNGFFALDLDRGKIYYTRDIFNNPDETARDIFQVNLDGSNQEVLAAELGPRIFDIDLSEDVLYINQISEVGSSVKTFDLNTQEISTVLDTSDVTGLGYEMAVYQPPVVPTLEEDAPQSTVSLTGITAGGGESQRLRVTARSNNPALISNPSVEYRSPDETGILSFIPNVNQSGTATITVTVEDAGPDGVLGTGTFEPAVNYSTGQVGRDMVLADLNADGNLDAIITADTGSTVAVLPGLGEGTFGTPTNFAVGNRPYAITQGDFNEDGRIDVATANADSGDVSILLGDGEGGFGTAASFPVGSNLSSIATGDLNEDGRLDLILTNTIQDTSHSVSILIGLGNGTFNTPTTLAVSENSRPEDVLVTDLNQDGHLDLVTANTGFPGGSDSLAVLLGHGDATFEAGQQYSVSDDPFGVAAGDFNNDGHPDLVTSTWGHTSQVSVLIGSGDGTFGTATHFDAGSSNYEIAVSDFDLDGNQDLVVGNAQSSTLSLLFGAGDGTFGPRTTLPVAAGPNGLVVADINADGADDILTSTSTSRSLSVLMGVRSDDNASVTRTFDVTVKPVNDKPTLDLFQDLTILEDAAEQTVNLAGVRAGGGESQPLKVTATSSDTGLIPHPAVTYTSADATGSLKFTPVADQHGVATITVTVEDGGLDGDLSTTTDNLTTSQTFGVEVKPWLKAPGNVDKDTDFDASDAMLMLIRKFNATDTQIENSKGTSLLTADQVRDRIDQIGTSGDVDGDGDFDSSDTLLCLIVEFNGTDTQINNTKGSSLLSAAEIKANVAALGQEPVTASSNSQQASVYAARRTQEEANRSDGADQQEIVMMTAEPPIGEEQVVQPLWSNVRSWLDAI